MSEKFIPFHQHLLVKAWVKNPPKEVEVLNKWFVELVRKVGMNVVAGPNCVYVNEPGNEGLTGTVTLATSHSSIHIWDELELPLIQFDIYSCKEFKSTDVIDCFNEWDLVKIEWVMIDRKHTLSIVSQGKLTYK